MNNAKVSVIIPSLDGRRNGNVDKLKAQLGAQTLPPHEVIVVVGVSPNGRARNEGVKKASGDFYVFIDDDVGIGQDKLIENLVRPFMERDDVGMTGASMVLPEDSNRFQRAAAGQIPRSVFPVQTQLVDSDMVTHACLAMPAKLFKQLGGENPDIVSGTDPDLRHRVRQAGYRVCIVPESSVSHPMPENFRSLMKLSYMKGRNSAIVRKKHPELILELDEGFRKNFAPKRSLPFRAARMLIIALECVCGLKFLKLLAMIAYAMGNIIESLKKS